MTPPAGRADWKVALVVAALVPAALCGGCMKDAVRLRVDAISQWHADHAAPLRAFAEAQAKASVAGARMHVRAALEATRLELAIELRESALDDQAACEEESTASAEEAPEQIQSFPRQWAQAEADRMNRVGSRTATLTIVQDYVVAQEQHWEAVRRARQRCEAKARGRLTESLTKLNDKFDKVVGEATGRLSRALRWHWSSCNRATRRALKDAEGHIEALGKCESWKPDDCKPPTAAGAGRRARNPLNVCLAAVQRTQLRLDQEIDKGQRRLQQYVRARLHINSVRQAGAAGT